MNNEPTPDNEIINGLWISPDGKPLSDLERLCIYSFCAKRKRAGMGYNSAWK